MYRALPVTRQAAQPASRGLVRVSRRVRLPQYFRRHHLNNSRDLQRLTTEAAEGASPSAPKKKKRILPRLVFYTTAATATFYIGSAFVSFNNRQYYDLFQSQIPFGAAVLEFAEAHDWDNLTVGDVVEASVNGSVATYQFARKQLGYATEETSDKAKKVKATISEEVKAATAAAERQSQEAKGKVQKVVGQLKTNIKANEEKVYEQGAKAAAIAKHKAEQFSEGVEDLVRQAEAALSGKPIDPSSGAAATPSQSVPAETEAQAKPSNLYDIPLPLGHEPPPGYSRPAPSKPPKAPAKEEAPAPLPLIAPVVAELSSSEPVLAHLASTIDNLASFLNSNPSASSKARDVLDTAKTDLTELAHNFDKVKEEEERKLERQMDEQSREYTLKLLELELEAQDKLANQEAGFLEYLDGEKTKLASFYREKMQQELETQKEIINER